jgi:hypothetical protein
VSGTRRLQIRGVDQGQRRILDRALGQHRHQQLLIDAPQTADATALPKLVQHPHIGHRLAVGQLGKTTPVALLGQQSDQVVERVDRRKHAQKVDAIQLCRIVLLASATPTMPRHQLVDKAVRDIRREQFQKLHGTGRRQSRIHGYGNYPKNNAASRPLPSSPLFRNKKLFISYLHRIP